MPMISTYNKLKRISLNLLDNIISWKFKIIGMRKWVACWCKRCITRSGSQFKSQ